MAEKIRMFATQYIYCTVNDRQFIE